MTGDPVIIEAAINGVNSRERNPHIPITPEEVAEDAKRCLDAGAAIIHAHNHDVFLDPEKAAEAYLEAWAPVLTERPNTLWYPTLSGDATNTMDEKYRHYSLIAAQIPVQFAVVDPGCTNFGHPDAEGFPTGYSYVNSYADIRAGFAICEDLSMGPSIAIYEPGFLQTVLSYHRAGHLPAGSMVKFYFGGEWGMFAKGRGVTFGLPPTEYALRAYVEMLKGTGLPWSVSVWGADLMDTAVPLLALELGGHLHVGLEEHFDPDRKPTNAELVAEAADLCRRAGRSVASPAETHELIFGSVARTVTI
ncbi:MAG TPA: 3-keto-5-aminohexanoate cleavage protein [Acidimicrobiales bacterium]|jgi:3-keto-5-aminohexanoate cleavage enzyme|nr:3-keto-5-aminohexanoate cleavage protein [Acidimicrobiales bacterium]